MSLFCYTTISNHAIIALNCSPRQGQHCQPPWPSPALYGQPNGAGVSAPSILFRDSVHADCTHLVVAHTRCRCQNDPTTRRRACTAIRDHPRCMQHSWLVKSITPHTTRQGTKLVRHLSHVFHMNSIPLVQHPSHPGVVHTSFRLVWGVCRCKVLLLELVRIDVRQR